MTDSGAYGTAAVMTGREQSLHVALTYISSPTMGRGPMDALEYVQIMDDFEVRDVLARCIRMARHALDTAEDHAPTPATSDDQDLAR